MTGHASNERPPPWQLTGRAVLLVYRFPRRFVDQQGGLPPELAARYVGGFGAVMCVDYRTSNIGAYRELVFIPGQVRAGGKRRWTISRIYVSTAASVESGIRNWAIPKQQAQFQVAARATMFRAGPDGTGFDLEVRPIGPALPAATGWLPAPAELAQSDADSMLVTRPRGYGAVRLAQLVRLHVDRGFFPAVDRFRPLLVLYVPQFRLCFPSAKAIRT